MNTGALIQQYRHDSFSVMINPGFDHPHDKEFYVFDMDRTLSNTAWREWLVDNPEPDYDTFYSLSLGDTPIT